MLFLNLYTFKRSSILHSSVVSHLCRFNRDNVNVEDYEETYIRKMFMSLSTDGDGFINLKDLVDGFEKDLMQSVRRRFLKILGEPPTFKPEWDKALRCMDSNNDGKIAYDEFLTAAYNR